MQVGAGYLMMIVKLIEMVEERRYLFQDELKAMCGYVMILTENISAFPTLLKNSVPVENQTPS